MSLAAYLIVLVTLLVLDGVWLGVMGKRLYKPEMGALMKEPVSKAPAAAFYLLYPVAIVYLCLLGSADNVGQSALRGAVLGAAAYGAYNLTNLAIVRGWPVRLSFVDLAWGTVATAVTAAVGSYVVLRLATGA